MGTQVVRNVRPLGAAAVDVVLDGTLIEALVPAGGAPAQLPLLVDGGGQLLLPALVEGHVHFDETLWGLPWRPNTAGPTRNDRIANEQRLLPGIGVPIAERAGPLIEHCIARGLQYFDPGTQGEHKLARGFEPTRTTSAHWLEHAGFRNAVARYLERERAAVDDYIEGARQHLPFQRTTAAPPGTTTGATATGEDSAAP